MTSPIAGVFRPDLLQGKRILITGGGSGIGKAVGRRYLELGAELVICGRRAELLESAAVELRAATGGRVTPITCNITQPSAVTALMDRAWQEGPIDILMNNAAGNFIARTERLSARAFDSVVNVTLHGAAYCTMEVGRRWIDAARAGTILNVVGQHAWTGYAFTVPSAAAKAGLLAMTRSLAVEWGPRGIRVLAVSPGYFPTDAQMANLNPGRTVASLAQTVPLRRVGVHQELADMCAFLVSDAASYVTGECVVIDGGKWLGEAGGRNGEVIAMQAWSQQQWDEARRAAS